MNPHWNLQEGYKQWANATRRKHSLEVDFGVWWRLPGRPFTWRVSWIEHTGELYAVEQSFPSSGFFIVLGIFATRDEVEAAMAGWTEFDSDLAQLLARTAWLTIPPTLSSGRASGPSW